MFYNKQHIIYTMPYTACIEHKTTCIYVFHKNHTTCMIKMRFSKIYKNLPTPKPLKLHDIVRVSFFKWASLGITNVFWKTNNITQIP